MKTRKKEKDSVEKAKEYFLKPSVTLDGWPQVKGFDFNDSFTIESFVESLNTTGFQAHNLYRAVLIARKMQDDNASIFLGYTSNMVSSGIREQIRWLAEHNKVHLLATTAGGIEEDIIKCLKPFVIGSYDAKGSMLRDEGVNRTGNIFIPNDRYVYLERFLYSFFDKMYERQKNTGEILSESQLLWHLGFELKDDKSILYWASKNDIPYFCPGLYDGALGDVLYFYKRKNPGFIIDSAKDTLLVHDIAINTDKAGIIALGGGAPKHLIANINQFRDGADYAILITTAMEYEGSNAGANIEESISWGKVKADAKHVKIVSEATLAFPLFVKAGFVDYNPKDKQSK